MTYLLVLHFLSVTGEQATYGMAVFSKNEDCRMAGHLVAKHMSENNDKGISVKYSCDPIV